MRVVLRHPETGLYLQASGDWTPERATAKEFPTAVIAYWWAVERKLSGAEVWMAVKADARRDFPCAKVPSGSSHPVLDCEHEDWSPALHSFLYNGIEADLSNFVYEKHGESCDLLAQAFSMDFMLDRDPQARAAHFRKKQTGRHSIGS